MKRRLPYLPTLAQLTTRVKNFVLPALLVLGLMSAHAAAPDRTDENDRIHPNERETPYPQAGNGLFINPAPLIVPKAMKRSDYLQFALSPKADFPAKGTTLSKPAPWCMFNPHEALKPGVWYWRFRSVSKTGEEMPWSETYRFTMTKDVPQFVTPKVDVLMQNLPKGYPRLHCYLNDGLEAAQKTIQSHPEYKDLIGRASKGLKSDYSTLDNPYTKGHEMSLNCNYMHQAYVLTEDPVYAEKMVEYARMLIAATPIDKLLRDDFYCGGQIFLLANVYDVCYDRLSDTERKQMEVRMMDIAKHHHRVQTTGKEENHIFNNHFWQQSFREMLQLGLLLYDKNAEARQMLEYCYELWTARAPASGFNRDGEWHNGTGYMAANMTTLYYVPMLFTHLTATDFLQHPWYQNLGKALAYAWPPKSMSAGFGDGNELESEPTRQRTALADFMARETGDPYAAWYAKQCPNLKGDYETRLYRIVSDSKTRKGAANLPVDARKAVWFQDCGEMIAHSSLDDTKNNLFLSFRSSPFGSGSHTLADQNAFNLHFRGVPIYRATGYYLNFSDPHNLLSYRHTRAHNTLLVDGIGQPFTTRAYGNVVRMLGGEHISYCLGDASNAYCGVSEYPMWERNFANHGLEQSVANGFGPTPLKLYRRHIFLLHPDKVVIYDEMEAHKAVRWDWLLHSPVQFFVDEKMNRLTTRNEEKKFSSVAQLFSDQSCQISQTNEYVAAPNPKLVKYGRAIPKQWHLAATFAPSVANRILTVIQVQPDGTKTTEITRSGNRFECGDWTIEAELNANKPAALSIRNAASKANFSYGDQSPVIDGKKLTRQTKGSSLLYDEVDGKWQVQEMTDREALRTGAN